VLGRRPPHHAIQIEPDQLRFLSRRETPTPKTAPQAGLIADAGEASLPSCDISIASTRTKF
jgi:hypothetical protein